MTTNGALALLDKSISFFDRIITDHGQSPLTVLAREADLPQASAYRIAASFLQSGMLMRGAAGRYLPGPALIRYSQTIQLTDIVAQLATPLLKTIVKRFGQVAHLGVLEDGMVTYLIKAGNSEAAQFTRQGMQLEAYCSGIGKVLLAHLPEDLLRAYLKNGPFIPLTPRTIIDPEKLRLHLHNVLQLGFAIDDAEVAENLLCVAVPVMLPQGGAVAALSVSGLIGWFNDSRIEAVRDALMAIAAEISDRLK